MDLLTSDCRKRIRSLAAAAFLAIVSGCSTIPTSSPHIEETIPHAAPLESCQPPESSEWNWPLAELLSKTALVVVAKPVSSEVSKEPSSAAPDFTTAPPREGGATHLRWTLQVESALKGTPAREIQIVDAVVPGNSKIHPETCEQSYDFQVGRQYLVFVGRYNPRSVVQLSGYKDPFLVKVRELIEARPKKSLRQRERVSFRLLMKMQRGNAGGFEVTIDGERAVLARFDTKRLEKMAKRCGERSFSRNFDASGDYRVILFNDNDSRTALVFKSDTPQRIHTIFSECLAERFERFEIKDP